MNIVDSNSFYIHTAQAYYAALLAKDFDTMASYLHTDVVLVSPLAEIKGKQTVIHAAKNLSTMLNDIYIKSWFAKDATIMFTYDFMFCQPIDRLRSAVYMQFIDGLIAHIDLWYDPRPFVEQRQAVFNSNTAR